MPVHIHSHPNGARYFSGYDDTHEEKLFNWLSEQGQPLLWSLVWPYGTDPIARLWTKEGILEGVVRVGLRPMDGSVEILPALDRQRIFGPSLRRAAAQLSICIVGVGGVGMQVAEQLARSGFSRFVLIDPDTVSETNLNRLPGTIRKDLGKLKVNVARRIIRKASKSIGSNQEVVVRSHDVYTADSSTHDLIRECDVVLALTDDHLSRNTCLMLALEGGATYIQAGVEIPIDDDGELDGLWAEVTGAEVGRYCPICSGRLDPGQASVEARLYDDGEVAARALKEGYIPEEPAPSVMSLNSLVAGLLVTEIQQRIAGFTPKDLIQVELRNGRYRKEERIDRQLSDSCGVCGRS